VGRLAVNRRSLGKGVLGLGGGVGEVKWKSRGTATCGGRGNWK